MKRCIGWLGFLALCGPLLGDCGSALGRMTASPPESRPASAPSPDAAATRSTRWGEDLTALVDGLRTKHKNAFFKTSQAEFEKAAESVRARLDRLQDHQIIVEFMKLGAMLGDGHSGLDYGGVQPPFRAFPFAIMAFNDGVYIIAATEPHKDLIGKRIVRVGSVPADEAIERVSAVFAYENESWRKHSLRRFINIAEVLHAVGVIDDTERTSLTVMDDQKRETAAELTPLKPGERPAFITYRSSITEKPPLSLEGRQQWSWFQSLPEEHASYCRYDRCADQPGTTVKQFGDRLLAHIDGEDAPHLIVDLRNNGGGNSALFDPVIAALKHKQSKGTLGRTIVLIGRATFSSGQLNAASLRRELGATVIGEPTGQKPNAYGEVRTFKLPHSGLTVSYSTKLFHTDPTDRPSMMPDVAVDATAADLFANRDRAFEKALEMLKAEGAE